MAILEHSTNKVAAKWSIWSGCGRSDGEVDKWWVRADRQPKCSEWQERAHCVNLYSLLRALAARKMPRERKFRFRRAVGKPVVHGSYGEDQKIEFTDCGTN